MRAMALIVGGSLLLSASPHLRSAELASSTKRLTASAGCSVSKDDEQWIVSSLSSWDVMQRELMPTRGVPTTAIFFDEDCIYRLDPFALGETTLRASTNAHQGRIPLPSGNEIPAGVTSFAAPGGRDSVFFVMALPSVWQTAGRSFAFDMRTFLTAVMIHEMSHATQFRTYLQQSAAVEGIELLGKNVNDDIVQERFGGDESFAQSVSEETRVLFAAAAAASAAECRSLARRALALMLSRQATYYVDERRALTALENIFLTLEGSGQFAALAWLTHPAGAGLAGDVARREFGEGVRFWSQRQGLAVFLVLERLAPDWKRIVYGDGSRTAIELLDDALK